MAVAKRRALDHLRRDRMLARKHEELGVAVELRQATSVPDVDAGLDDPIGDDVLPLAFLCCHPVLAREARVALTLRLLGGLTTEEVARGFLVGTPAIAQRIVRAKRTLREARVPFELPAPRELAERLSSVLEVVYLIFNEGYTATAGDDWVRPALCHEALRLGRILQGLAPEEPEVHGLAALMELQASRLRARVDAAGTPVLLPDQDRTRWDQLLLRRGLAALERAERLRAPLGPYALQAEIAACHARARAADKTDWDRIVALYDALAQVAPSPVVELNRAVAVGMAHGPEAGLDLVERLADDPVLRDYHLLPAVRADFLLRLARFEEAGLELERAASLTQNARERDMLVTRAAAARAARAHPREWNA